MESSAETMRFASPDIVAEPAGDGCLLLRSVQPLGDYPVTVIHSLRAWASEDPAEGRRPGARSLRELTATAPGPRLAEAFSADWRSPFTRWQGSLTETSSLALAADVTSRALAGR